MPAQWRPARLVVGRRAARNGHWHSMPELSTIVETGKNKHFSLGTETMKEHWQLPVAASALLHSPEFVVLARRECALKLLIEDEDGTPKAITLQFAGVESYKCTYRTSCTASMFDLAYGKLVSLDSTWLDELRNVGRTNQATINALQHLMITFDDGPCYEIICRSWNIND
jgi:hypothetical protein